MRKTVRGTFAMTRNLHHNFNTVLKDYNLTMMQFIFLRIVDGEDNVTISKAADLSKNDRPTISAIFNRLYDKKMVKKKENKDDRRSFFVKLEKGTKEILSEANEALKEEELRFFSVLDEEETEMFKRCIEKLRPKRDKKKEDEEEDEEFKKTK